MPATSAFALSGSSIKLAEAQFFGPPSVAVDGAGTAYVAWADEKGPAEPSTIHYCVLPAGAAGCTHANVLTPAGGAPDPVIDKVQVLVDGATVVLLADVYGVGKEYGPEQEWTSTDGGATFVAVDGGKSVADGILSADTGPLGAVIVPGSSALGYAWVTAAGPPTFAEFPFGSSPPQCSTEHACPFATLQSGSEHLLGNPGGAFASQLGVNPGVLGVYETLGKPGCASGSFDTAYVYGGGSQEASNSYDISPGKAKSAWKVGLSPADCEVEYPAVGGGPSGLGVVEDNLASGSTVYHPFDQVNDDFDTPMVTIAREIEESPSVSQDGAGGIYVTYLAGFRGAVRLAYSSNGGASWVGPATLSAAGASDVASSVGPTGQGWATWQVGESVYAQQFVAGDAVPPPIVAPVVAPAPAPAPPPPPPAPDSGYRLQSVVIGANGTVSTTFVPTQSGEATIVVTVPTATLAGASAVAAKSKRCRHGQVKLKGRCLPTRTVVGKTSAKGTAGVPLKLVVHLSGKARAQLAQGKTVHLTVTLTYLSALGGKPAIHSYSLTAKSHRPKRKRR